MMVLVVEVSESPLLVIALVGVLSCVVWWVRERSSL